MYLARNPRLEICRLTRKSFLIFLRICCQTRENLSISWQLSPRYRKVQVFCLDPHMKDDTPFLLTGEGTQCTSKARSAWEDKDNLSLHFILFIWKLNSLPCLPEFPWHQRRWNLWTWFSHANIKPHHFHKRPTLSEAGKREVTMHAAVTKKLQPTWRV